MDIPRGDGGNILEACTANQDGLTLVGKSQIPITELPAPVGSPTIGVRGDDGAGVGYPGGNGLDRSG